LARPPLNRLNMVTSNHIHILVRDNGTTDIIPKSIQLIAGRTGQEYNRRKKRKGAFWEDRYHATAVETDNHLIRCLVYMDMVRAGVVNHPSEWKFSGYNEIQAPRYRYALIDHEGLSNLFDFGGMEELAEAYQGRGQERDFCSAAAPQKPLKRRVDIQQIFLEIHHKYIYYVYSGLEVIIWEEQTW
jgi:hypothetical protein